MTRYGYARVSTTKQSTDSQTSDLQKEGIPSNLIITETLSGATSWKQRPELSRLVHRLKAGDTLTVAKLDRRNRPLKAAIDHAACLCGVFRGCQFHGNSSWSRLILCSLIRAKMSAR